VKLFCIKVIPDQLVKIKEFIIVGQDITKHNLVQCRQLVTRSVDYQLIAGKLYKLGADDILRHCSLKHKQESLLYEVHEGIFGGHNVGKATAHKVLCTGI